MFIDMRGFTRLTEGRPCPGNDEKLKGMDVTFSTHEAN